MARRAVQGFPEKSYYENTKYAGVLATNDSLNEGYFKQLVNFNISDTGQSLQPRKGFLTTTLIHEGEYISLSNFCVMFREENLNKHIIFDVLNNKGYIVDISAYNITNYFLPVTHVIVNYDWTAVIDYLKLYSPGANKQVIDLNTYPLASSWFEGKTEFGITYNEGYQLSSYAIKGISEIRFGIYDPVSGTGVTYAIKEFVTGSTQTISTLATLLDLQPGFVDYIGGFFLSYNINTTTGLLNLTIAMGKLSNNYVISGSLSLYDRLEVETHADVLEMVESVGETSKIIKDIYLIEKDLFRMNLDFEGVKQHFLTEILYREEQVTINGVTYPADTLVLSFVPVHQHPTIDISERNIASPVSIIPEMQTIYTVKPEGEVSYLQTVFVEDSAKEYYINFIFRNTLYKFIPHFSLIPAYNALNEVEPLDCHWAFRFTFTSTRKGEEKIFYGPWLKHNGISVPTKLFNKSIYTDLNTSTVSERVYQGSQTVIYLVPPNINHENILTYSYDSEGTSAYPAIDTAELPAANVRYQSWLTKINAWDYGGSIEDLFTSLGVDAMFLVYKFSERESFYDPTSELHKEHLNNTFVHTTLLNTAPTSYGNYFSNFKNSQHLKDLYKDGYFEGERITFKFFPLASKAFFAYKSQLTEPSIDVSGFCFLLFASNYVYGGSSLFTGDVVKLISNNLEDASETYSVLQNDRRTIQISTDKIQNLIDTKYISIGYSVGFHIRPYHKDEVTGISFKDVKILETTWMLTSFNTQRTVLFGQDHLQVSKIPKYTLTDSRRVLMFTDFIVYDQSRIVLWKDNVLYISEPGSYFHFKEKMKKTFGEKIVKVLQFKTILLVFTVQHLYAVYETEVDTLIDTGEEEPVMAKEKVWASHCVLYNILTNEKYKDAIQVFNQMVLFYSEDGQMFMIKPNVMVDSETQFSLHYFNKAANDILLNYDEYINERLKDYNLEKVITKADVQIKVSISINEIKVFYFVPGYITYVLVYDVINNYYTMFDTLSFNDLSSIRNCESGEVYLTRQNEKIFITHQYTEPNLVDSYVDMSFLNNFKKVPVNALMDTGNINLNNHLIKRFRDLFLTFRNLSTGKVLISVIPFLDGIVSRMIFENRLEVKDIDGASHYVYISKHDQNALLDLIDQTTEQDPDRLLFDLNNPLFEEQNMLFNFEEFNSSKYLTHRSSILGMGKVLRLRVLFVSKGLYKIISYGVVFKERRI